MLASYRVHEISSRDALTPGLSVLRTKVFRSPVCMQDILPSNLRKNFSDLALLAMQHYRLAFQNSFSVWTTYEIDPYHCDFTTIMAMPVKHIVAVLLVQKPV
jgi:hypothetical protein